MKLSKQKVMTLLEESSISNIYSNKEYIPKPLYAMMQLIEIYNKEMHQGLTKLTKEQNKTLDESEIENFESWCLNNDFGVIDFWKIMSMESVKLSKI